MMAERKRNSANPSVKHAHGTFDPNKDYLVERIIREDKKLKKYLIAWADDPETGEKFEPTWEPRRNANQVAVQEFKDKQAAEKATKTCKHCVS